MTDTLMTENPNTLRELRVLLVDDDPDQRWIVSRLFARHGVAEPSEAADAEQAVAAARAQRPHLIVLDLAMPGRSGFDVLPDLIEAAPRAVVVVLSNLPRHRLVDRLRRRGAVGFVEKRVAPDQLVDEILTTAALAELARHHVIELPGALSAMATGRRFVRQLLGHDVEMAGDVELLVSELVTNAVIHTTSEPRLEVRLTPAAVRIEVYDADPTLPAPRVPDESTPGGRGLLLMHQLASRWGAEPVDGGKVVWFEVDRAR